MNFNKKWLYVVVLSAILVPLIIIFVLSVTDPTKKKEEVKINNASYTTADGRVTVTAKVIMICILQKMINKLLDFLHMH